NDKYDNQPGWSTDGTYLLYCSVRDTSKADVYKYALSTSKNMDIINTPLTAEYSPMMMPNKVNISVVQVLEDDSTQILAKCDDKEDHCVNLLPKFKQPVGYYAWVDANRVVMYVLGDPATLQLADVSTGKVDTIAEDVGRCVQKVPGKNLEVAFVDKSSDPWQIKLYDVKSGKITNVVNTLEDEEDFCFMPDGSLLMGHETGLYRYAPPATLMASASGGRSSQSAATAKSAPQQKGQDKNSTKEKEKEAAKQSGKKSSKKEEDTAPWDKVADFKGTAIENFYRLAVSPKGNKIAIVTYEDEKP
ncbi:MAG: hypothetical protein ACHQD9_00515, partial [Chitinophagales bacterium]